MASYRLAKSDSATRLLLARTNGRTNERPNHLKEIPSVLNRTGGIDLFTRSDMDFTEFILTRSTPRVKREQFVESVTVTLHRMYDQETERLRTLMRHERRAA